MTQSDYHFLAGVLDQNERNDLARVQREIERRERLMKARLAKALTEEEKVRIEEVMEGDKVKAEEKMAEIKEKYGVKRRELEEKSRY